MIEAHRSPTSMVKCLVQYIPCDERVRHEVRSEFGTSPALDEIRRMRESYQRTPVEYPMEMGWDWNGDKHEDLMARASKRLVAALSLERGE